MSETTIQSTKILWKCKGLLALSVGLFMTLVGIDNLLYPEINQAYVQHVLAMDTMLPWFPKAFIEARSIDSPLLHALAFGSIVGVQLIAGILCSIAGGLMVLAKTDCRFEAAKISYMVGGTLCILLWFIGFFTIGAEWFALWASQWAGGQMKSLAIAMFVLLSMLFVAQR